MCCEWFCFVFVFCFCVDGDLIGFMDFLLLLSLDTTFFLLLHESAIRKWGWGVAVDVVRVVRVVSDVGIGLGRTSRDEY